MSTATATSMPDAKRPKTVGDHDSDRAKILEIVQEAGRAAGKLMRDNIGRAKVTVKSGETDLVTQVDKQCQEEIEGFMKRNFPSHVLLGEEDVAAGSAASDAAMRSYLNEEWLWVVDPIDGTTNFVHACPTSVVSIAVAHRGEVEVACIYEPYRDEMYTAIKGEGAKCNGQPIRVDNTENYISALVAFGIGTNDPVRLPMLRALQQVSGCCRSVRNLGAAALHMSWLAAGRFTLFWELDLNAWDLAAGALLISEAGGKVTDTSGAPFTLLTRHVVASNGAPGVHEEHLRILRETNAVEKQEV